ncbi:MAG: hypothetical protein H6Q40_112, partial [Deltaproteobacteria bacterium]|nr:hypothetical protein [Deltaproteobacteria bacterium]
MTPYFLPQFPFGSWIHHPFL